MEWKTYQMFEEIGEGVERRGHQKGQKRAKSEILGLESSQINGKQGKMS